LDPEILLIDEVLAVGDVHFQAKCRAKISEFRRRNVTMVLVSHSGDEIRRLCTRAIWLDRGKIVGQGPPDSVLPLYEAAALPTPTTARSEARQDESGRISHG
jgi:ABC-type polysaccharide/polyol phosphate transport system ATPase subunit